MSILLFIVILLVLIVVHEYGHFIVAKKSGIRVDEFGIGFPPRAFTYMRKNGTDYTINWLLFGGFVRIFGENPNEESLTGPDSERSFSNKPKLIRAGVLVAGVVMNMLLAWVLLSAIFMVGTDIALDDTNISDAQNVHLIVADVFPGSPAEGTGLIPGDTILSLRADGESAMTYTPEAISTFIAEHADEPFTMRVERGGEDIEVTLSAEKGFAPGEPDRRVIGIAMGLVGHVQYLNPFKALYEGGVLLKDLTVLVWNGLSHFFAGLLTFSADFSEVAGPIGIVGVVGQAAGLGITSLLFLVALISVNLAIINILPIPALDGGRLLFLLIEAFKGSPVDPKIANRIHGIFFALLIALILAVSYFDIARLIG